MATDGPEGCDDGNPCTADQCGAAGTADFDEIQFARGPCPSSPPIVCTPATCP